MRRSRTGSENLEARMSSLVPKQITRVGYHGGCPDGIASAVVAWMFMKLHGLAVKFTPMRIGQAMPMDWVGQYVVMCDISMSWNLMEPMLKQLGGFMLIDHHKSAERDLEHLRSDMKIFDMKHSGAGLTWRWFFPGIVVPRFIELIEDRDIWNNKFPESKFLHNWMETQDLWDEAKMFPQLERMLIDEEYLAEVIDLGRKYEVIIDSNVKQALKHVDVALCKIRSRYYIVGSCNTTVSVSEIGNRILSEYPLVDFAACFNVGRGSSGFSLRSADDRTDVSIIAKLFGGGGHRNSSGLLVLNVVDRLPGKYSGVPIEEVLRSMRCWEFRVAGQRFNTIAIQVGIHYADPVLSYLTQDDTAKKVANRLVIGFDKWDMIYCWNYDPIQDKTQIAFKLNTTLCKEDVETILGNFEIASGELVPEVYRNFDFRYMEFDGLWQSGLSYA